MRLPGLLPFLLLALFSHSTARDTLTINQTLTDGEIIVSSGGVFALGFFSPSNTTNRYVGIWYNKIRVQTVVWVANRQTPISGVTGSFSLNSNGTLVVTDHNSTVIWSSTPTTPSSSAVSAAQLLDSGNLVVGGVWQSFDYPTDTLLPGMKLGWDLTTGFSRNLTAWMSPTNPSAGDMVATMDIRGDPQLTVWEGSTRKWRSGPWNGIEISGIPEMRSYSGFSFSFVVNASEVYYSYTMTDPTIVTRLTLYESGTMQRFVWLDGQDDWSVFWYVPKTPCDSFSPCGPYGLCDPNGSPMCSCLQGFEPRSPEEWQLRDGSAGCRRRTALACRNGTDGFMKVANALPPDTSAATVNRTMSLDDCRAACIRNCSCTGYANADVRNGGTGCLIWSTDMVDLEFFVNGGQDLYVRLAGADLAAMQTEHSRNNKTKNAVVATFSLFFGALLLSFVACYITRRRKKKKNLVTRFSSFNGVWQDESGKGNPDLELPIFDLATVVTATANFSAENKLGEGGFGPVYKGIISEGEEIAVKRLSKTSLQGIDEFKNEVTLIAKLQHRNLVRLLGCCIQSEERILIYEYLRNKSLDTFLFGKGNGVYLDWPTRYQIILGVSRGLLYLHQDSRFRIIHRDLKASNILLDEEMNPKISDFGMARIFGGEDAKTKTMRVVGTYGYMSPEYALDGIFSVKSDVFSFGVLVLEIISGQRNKGVYLSTPNLHLLGNAWSLWKEDKSLELVDQTIRQSFSMVEVMRCIQVGLLCVQECAEDRPTMPSVVLMLGSDVASLPKPRQPGFVAKRENFGENPLSKEQDSNTNSLIFTMTMGR